VAHFKLEEVLIVVVFLDTSFYTQTAEDRQRVYRSLQSSAQRAGLEGDVIALWQDAGKRTRFLAPPQQHPFFQVVNYGQLRAQASGASLAVESDLKG
jgi:hypothetical protein